MKLAAFALSIIASVAVVTLTLDDEPHMSDAATHIVSLIEDEGYTCDSDEAATDMIVVDFGTMAEVQTFEQAKGTEGTIVAYCTTV